MNSQTISKLKTRENLFKLLQYREQDADSAKFFPKFCQFSDDMCKRLGLEHELQGHQGCVNCLQWSKDGMHLASGSDDTMVIIWDPFRHKKLEVIPTNHFGNIFSVKYLGTNNDLIATAAADCKVLVQSIKGPNKSDVLLDCQCHVSRVKRLATTPEEATVFWSAGEDGYIMQFDLREQHECSVTKPRPFLDLKEGQHEIKCIAVNPTKPHYLAVGVNDCYVRMYDRRMIRHHDKEYDAAAAIPKNCVQYFAPGHLAVEYSKASTYRFTATYLTFNNAGTEMLVNLGGEQIYLFDVNTSRSVDEMRIPNFNPGKRQIDPNKCRCVTEENGSFKMPEKPAKFYEHLNSKELNCAFYMRRASRYFRRRWVGDIYNAARDFLYVIQNWPAHLDAHVGFIKCLIYLNWEQEIQQWLEHVSDMFPSFSSSTQASKLYTAFEKLKAKNAENQDGSGSESSLRVPPIHIDEDETCKRLSSCDYELRFLGHCNTTTDIKEASFMGDDGNYICAGSDEGIIFVWERKTCSIVTALFGDVSIVNCVQPHPQTCMIASSGIDPVVRLWWPMAEELDNPRKVRDLKTVMKANQNRMILDPFESMLANMGGYRLNTASLDGDEDVPNCRTC